MSPNPALVAALSVVADEMSPDYRRAGKLVSQGESVVAEAVSFLDDVTKKEETR
jgi:hypothetical protein